MGDVNNDKSMKIVRLRNNAGQQVTPMTHVDSVFDTNGQNLTQIFTTRDGANDGKFAPKSDFETVKNYVGTGASDGLGQKIEANRTAIADEIDKRKAAVSGLETSVGNTTSGLRKDLGENDRQNSNAFARIAALETSVGTEGGAGLGGRVQTIETAIGKYDGKHDPVVTVKDKLDIAFGTSEQPGSIAEAKEAADSANTAAGNAQKDATANKNAIATINGSGAGSFARADADLKSAIVGTAGSITKEMTLTELKNGVDNAATKDALGKTSTLLGTELEASTVVGGTAFAKIATVAQGYKDADTALKKAIIGGKNPSDIIPQGATLSELKAKVDLAAVAKTVDADIKAVVGNGKVPSRTIEEINNEIIATRVPERAQTLAARFTAVETTANAAATKDALSGVDTRVKTLETFQTKAEGDGVGSIAEAKKAGTDAQSNLTTHIDGAFTTLKNAVGTSNDGASVDASTEGSVFARIKKNAADIEAINTNTSAAKALATKFSLSTSPEDGSVLVASGKKFAEVKKGGKNTVLGVNASGTIGFKTDTGVKSISTNASTTEVTSTITLQDGTTTHNIIIPKAGSAAGVVTAEAQSFVGDKTFGGNVVIGGNLTVNGDTTTINVGTLEVEDKNITVAKGSRTDGDALNAGIEVCNGGAAESYPALHYKGQARGWAFEGTGDKLTANEMTATKFTGALAGKATTAGTADQVKNRIKVGSKTFDGSAQVDVALTDFKDTLGVAHGGTGLTTFTTNALLVGNGDAIKQVPAGSGFLTIVKGAPAYKVVQLAELGVEGFGNEAEPLAMVDSKRVVNLGASPNEIWETATV